MLGGLNAASLQISTHFPFDQAIPLTYTWVQYPIFKMIKKKRVIYEPIVRSHVQIMLLGYGIDSDHHIM